MKTVRIAWCINGHKGLGRILPIEETSALAAWCKFFNKIYGAGTHWLEFDP